MNPVTSVKSYILHTILKHLLILSKQNHLNFNVISTELYNKMCGVFWHLDSLLCVERQ